MLIFNSHIPLFDWLQDHHVIFELLPLLSVFPFLPNATSKFLVHQWSISLTAWSFNPKIRAPCLSIAERHFILKREDPGSSKSNLSHPSASSSHKSVVVEEGFEIWNKGFLSGPEEIREKNLLSIFLFYLSADKMSKKFWSFKKNPSPAIKVDKSELKKRLTPIQYRVTQDAATERYVIAVSFDGWEMIVLWGIFLTSCTRE